MDKRMNFAHLKVSTHNLGDHIQIIAANKLLSKFGVQPNIAIDRDNEISSFRSLHSEQVPILLNGWFKRNGHEWPPSDDLFPLFVGFHIRLHQCPELISERALEYYKQFEPIGCRDPYTADLLISKGVNAYFSHCLTLTFDKRKQQEAKEIIISSRDKEILEVLPNYIKNNCTYLTHYSDTNDFQTNMSRANDLLKLYREKASLVITTFLHCALPCIAMGIPTIIFYPKQKNKKAYFSDIERLSGLKNICNIYRFSEANQVNWSPEIVDVETIKVAIYNNVENYLRTNKIQNYL